MSRCGLGAAQSWARRGLGAVTVASVDGWTVLAPSGPVQARYPYDDAVRTFAGRPVARRMTPALGFFQVGLQAVVTVHPRERRPVQRWLIWTPRDGSVPPGPGLAAATVADIVAAAGTQDAGQVAPATRDIADLLADGTIDAVSVLRGILGRLALPGTDVVTGATNPADLPGAREVVPGDRHAVAFDRFLTEDRRRSLEGT